MNEIATRGDYNARQLALIKNTIARDTTDDEFNLYIEVAKRMGLDPFRRQIMPLVFSKDDAKKRRMSLVTGIDGFRVIANRCNDYRPGENEAEIEYEIKLKDSTNPLGIVKATVRCWKQDRAGVWHPVAGVAYWDEFVPLRIDADKWDWVETGETWPDSGKPRMRRQPVGETREVPDGNWGKMPRIMISKCAEAQALRRGWPEEFSGVYDPAELDRAQAEDRNASELVEQAKMEERQRRLGATDDLFIDWLDDKGIGRVPIGQFGDKAMAFLEANRETPSMIFAWRDANREPLREFWAKQPTDALELKKALETYEQQVIADAKREP